MTLHFALSVVLALAASLATAAFAVSVAERLAPWITRGTTQTMRSRKRKLLAPGGWTPLQSATVVLAAGIVLTVVLAFTLVVWLLGLAPARLMLVRLSPPKHTPPSISGCGEQRV